MSVSPPRVRLNSVDKESGIPDFKGLNIGSEADHTESKVGAVAKSGKIKIPNFSGEKDSLDQPLATSYKGEGKSPLAEWVFNRSEPKEEGADDPSPHVTYRKKAPFQSPGTGSCSLVIDDSGSAGSGRKLDRQETQRHNLAGVTSLGSVKNYERDVDLDTSFESPKGERDLGKRLSGSFGGGKNTPYGVDSDEESIVISREVSPFEEGKES